MHAFLFNQLTRSLLQTQHPLSPHSCCQGQPEPQSCSLSLHTQAHKPPKPEVQRLAVREFLRCSPVLALPSHSLQLRFRRLSSRHLNPHKRPLGNSACLMSMNCHLKAGMWPQISQRQKKTTTHTHTKSYCLLKTFDMLASL